ncbi:hypothetical protein PHYPSEUDO_002196 [Phytophthora pseudosyringae]|uniref:Uncharacterized protein n=1 Tax=Phytophthora pseudosyringae TaxID=221518 RepID=A0A8T1VY43_9STRA|nr:hypothetical protein PHYPSEUDO_002196 [Phytophthora pseudosyringae]
MRTPVLALGIALAQAHSISVRSLAAGSSSAFGSDSDIARQLFDRHRAGGADDQVSLNAVPAAVTTRLRGLDVTFSDLPGLVQRAVLWDTGFGLSPGGDAVQYTMADIAVPKDAVSDAGCTFKNCS